MLRGPLALLYGNAAGGVVQVFTEAGAPQPTLSVSGAAGSFGERRQGITFAATEGAHRYTVDASSFRTDGYRDHSSASRDQVNAKAGAQIGDVLVFVANKAKVANATAGGPRARDIFDLAFL